MKFEYKEKDIEIFNNLLKSHMICSGEFKIVSGSDITRYYNEDMYYQCIGTLGNSCMRYDECEDYFTVYEDHAKMLICLKNDLIVGRAIIWEIDDKTFMDRIYTCEDYLEESFINYAKENGWYIRENNSLLHSGDNQIWLGPNDEVIDYNLQIQLKTHYNLMPYMDSFRYFDPDNNTINTFDVYGKISLDNTDGTYEGYPYGCDCCGTIFTSYSEDEIPDELRWSDYEEQYLCEDCRVYCDGIYDYVNEHTNVIYVYTNRGRLLFPEDLVIDESVNIYDTHVLGSDRFVKIDDEWYTCDCTLITTNNKEFIIKNL